MPRMIRVRNKHSGDETRVSEKAYGHFAADFERLDDPPQAVPVDPNPPVAADPAKNRPSRGTAASNEKE